MDIAHTDSLPINLTSCDQEPIRIPGSIQPHGFLIALSGDSPRIAQVSDNITAFTGMSLDKVLDVMLSDVIGEEAAAHIRSELDHQRIAGQPAYLGAIQVAHGGYFEVLAHLREGLTILEFEAVTSKVPANFRLLYSMLGKVMAQFSDADTVASMSSLAAAEVKRVTGFGRVLVYRFDDDGHGHVVAETRDEGYHSYLGQRFPATDVPRQARELYLANHIRLIPNANYVPARLHPENNPLSGKPTDLSFAALRSVSPVHLQYMRNMGTLASMSMSIVVKGKLWGLISCHNADPCFVPFEVRAACEQLAQILALRVASREEGDESHYRLELRRMVVTMLAGLTQGPDFADNIKAIAPDLLRFASASGAALSVEDRVLRFGDAPDEAAVRALIGWMSAHAPGELYHTDSLSKVYPDGVAISRNASGVLAIPISRIHNHYLMWFRPEVIHTVDWAGNPHLKSDSGAPANPLTPRMSFDIWRETVVGTSMPWRASEIETASEFRAALLGVVLERAEQMAELAEELGRANKELEAFSYSVSHDLRAPLRHIVGFSDLLLEFEKGDAAERRVRFLKNIKESARFAGKLVDDLLNFSQMGRASLRPFEVNMADLVNAAKEKLALETGERQIEWRIEPLPVVQADPNFLQLAVYNLLSNAVKYTRPRSRAIIRVRAESREKEHVFHVTDNGVGFNMEYVHKLFGVFQRLHRMEDFPGTGIGLANVRRIVERHGGKVWANSILDQGATFSFSLPKTIALD